MEKQIKLLECKQTAMFARLNRVYETSQKVISSDTRLCEKFLAESETIDQLRTEFMENVDKINEICLDSIKDFIPNFEVCSAFDDLFSYIKRVRAKHDKSKFENETNTSSSDCTHNTKSVIKLPPIVLPSFDGKMENWSVFYESFKSNIHNNPQLSDSQRVQYLMGKLTHNALSLTAGVIPNGDNYQSLWESLVSKYQDKRSLGTYYLNSIFDLKPCTQNVNSLNKFIECFSSSVQALEQLQIPDLKDFILLFLALKKVDPHTAQQFEMNVRDKEIPSFKEFVEFTKTQVKILERTSNFRATTSTFAPATVTVGHTQKQTNSKQYSRSFVTETNVKEHCKFCNNDDHLNLYQCTLFKALPCINKIEYMKNNRGCLNCLSFKHSTYFCKSSHSCRHCRKRHHTLLHLPGSSSASIEHPTDAPATDSSANHPSPLPQSETLSHCARGLSSVPAPTPGVESTTVLTSVPHLASSSTAVLLSTAQVFAKSSSGDNVLIRSLLDNGSQDNIITTDCCKRLGLNITQLQDSFIKGVGVSSRPIRGFVVLNVKSRISPDNFNIKALVIDQITEKLPASFIQPATINCLPDITLADPTWNIPGEIDLIIGAQLFPYLLMNGRISATSSAPPAIETIFGYVFMGSIPTTHFFEVNSSSFLSVSEINLSIASNKISEFEKTYKTDPSQN